MVSSGLGKMGEGGVAKIEEQSWVMVAAVGVGRWSISWLWGGESWRPT
jgi:hypothetical protein